MNQPAAKAKQPCFRDRLHGNRRKKKCRVVALVLRAGVWGDARLNLTAILLLVYLGYIASRQFNKDLAKTAKNSSIIGIFGIIQIPILHFSVIWWRSVHQQASILSQETIASGDAPMSSDILVTLLISVLLVTLVHVSLTKRFRISNDISWADYLNPQSRAKI